MKVHNALLLLVVLAAWSCGPAPAPQSQSEPAAPAETKAETPQVEAAPQPKAEAVKPVPAKTGTPAPAAETPAPAPTPEAPAGPVTPPPAPDLKLEPQAALQAGPSLVKTGVLPAGTQVRYTLDGSDPASGKAFPAAGLSVTQSGRLRVWAAQPGGDASLAEALFTIGEVWVTPGGTGDGSWAHPAGTLDDAMAKASALGIKRLRLTSGQWSVKTDLSGTWELSGGWKAPGEASAPSVLAGSKQSGATQKEPAFALRATAGSKIVLSGLEVRSPSSSFASAVEVKENASVEISRSRLVGGNGLYGYGLHASGASVVIADSTLYGGDGGSTFALSAEKSTVKAVRSTFDAGTGDAVSYGLNLTLSKLTLVSSVVWGGAANSSYGVGLYSSDSAVLQGSTLLGGKGSSAWAVYLSESEPEIISCIIGAEGKSKSYGIFANYGKSVPKVLHSSAFFASATGAFLSAALGNASLDLDGNGAFADSSGRALGGQKGNLKAQPALGPSPDFRTLASSPEELLKGGEALSGDGILDRGGKARGLPAAPGAWAISQ